MEHAAAPSGAESPAASLILVTGPPAAGKTTVAQVIAEGLGLPVFHKDTIKELLADELGSPDLDASRTIGLASLRLLLMIARSEARARNTAVLESTFDVNYYRQRFEDIAAESGIRIVEVHCTAREEVLLARYRERSSSPERHHVHRDSDLVDNVRTSIRSGVWQPLGVSPHLIQIETSAPDSVDYEDVLDAVRRAMGVQGDE